MSRFAVTVCLPPMPPGAVLAAVTRAMAPFDYNDDARDGPGEWDRWSIGVDERFTVKPAHDGDEHLVYGDALANGTLRGCVALRCDGGPVGLLDFPRMRTEAVIEATHMWERRQHDWRRLVHEHPPALPLTDFLERHHRDPFGYPRAQAVADHHRQPLIKALTNTRMWSRYPSLGVWMLGPDRDPITELAADPQPELDTAAAWSTPTYALLTIDGQWIDPDRPTGLVDTASAGNGQDRARDRLAFARAAGDYIESLNQDVIIVRLGCHS